MTSPVGLRPSCSHGRHNGCAARRRDLRSEQLPTWSVRRAPPAPCRPPMHV